MGRRHGGTWDEGDVDGGWEPRGGRGRESGRGRRWEREEAGPRTSRGRQWEEDDRAWQAGRPERGRGRGRATGRGRDGGRSQGRKAGRGAWGDVGGAGGGAGVPDDDWFGGDASWLDDMFAEQEGTPQGRGGSRGRGGRRAAGSAPADDGLWGDFAGSGDAGAGADDFGGWGDMEFIGSDAGRDRGAGGERRRGREADGRGTAGRGDGTAAGSTFDDDWATFGEGGDVDRLLGELAAGGSLSGPSMWDDLAMDDGRKGGAGQGQSRGRDAGGGFDDVFAEDGFGAAFGDVFDGVADQQPRGRRGQEDEGWRGDESGGRRSGRSGGARGRGRRGGRAATAGEEKFDGGASPWSSIFDSPPERDGGAAGGQRGSAGGDFEWDAGFEDAFGGAPSGGRGSGTSAEDVGVGVKIEVTDTQSPFEGMQGVVKGVMNDGHVEAELDVFGMKTKKVIRVDEISKLDK